MWSLSTSDGTTECTTDGAAENDIAIGLFLALGPLLFEGPRLDDEIVISGDDIVCLVRRAGFLGKRLGN